MQLRLALAGDVMLARGIDQIHRSSVDPELREPAVGDARDYVALAERATGEVPRDVPPHYVWGDLRNVLDEFAADAVVLNLETSFTTANNFDTTKGIHYRTHPDNAAVLTAIGKPVCSLANNHVLDLGEDGLRETLETLDRAELPRCGAGHDAEEALRPAVVRTRAQTSERGTSGTPAVAVVASCLGDAGVPPDWAAGEGHAGVFRLRALDDDAAGRIRATTARHRNAGQTVVVSVHWGGNWGYDVGMEKREFAHALIDSGAADVVYGHSSHHPRPLEIYRDAPIIYGCGDLINDYEGIGGHESYRPEITALYLITLDAVSRRLVDLRLAPFHLSRFRLHRARDEQAEWLADTLSRENARVEGPLMSVTPDGLFISAVGGSRLR
jgi:poly-gamma-glutamate synthesis protein (capsule biosynthesis protein)